MLKLWLAQVRAPFLILSVLLCALGGAVAHRDGMLHWPRLVLCTIGVVLAHVAVNLFNELSDHTTGIDANTRRTPFSGGSGTLQSRKLSVRAVTIAAISSSVAASGIGAYLSFAAGGLLVPFIVAGGLAAVFYTSHLARWMLGELSAGLTLGSFVVIGTYCAQTGELTAEVALISIPPGILTALLLLLNEFPDAEADRAGGRHHLVIALGHRRAAILYALALFSMYLFLGAGVALRWFPSASLLGFLTIPLAIRASLLALTHGSEHDRMLPALASNVFLVLSTDAMIAAGYFLDSALGY